MHEHPEAELPVNVVAEVLEEEAEAASAEVALSGSRQTNKHGGFR